MVNDATDQAIKIGTTVRLIGGGPRMSVVDLPDPCGMAAQATCIWFGKAEVRTEVIEKLHRETFPIASLKFVDVEKEDGALRELIDEMKKVLDEKKQPEAKYRPASAYFNPFN